MDKSSRQHPPRPLRIRHCPCMFERHLRYARDRRVGSHLRRVCAIFVYFAFGGREPPPGDVGLELARLAYLHAQGVLTEEEFLTAKARLLGTDTTG